MMVDSGIKGGKVVFTASVLAFMSFAGYGQYAPTKFALRGLAETLRNELKQHDIDVHIYYPGTILSPGLETENARKPALTKVIEGADAPLTPEQCAQAMLSGVDCGDFAIASDFIGQILRCVTIGISPTNNLMFDWFLTCLGWVRTVTPV
jgi:3-dehydrosphinganine reductase